MALLSLPAATAAAAPAGPALPLARHKLANGLTLVIRQDARVPLVHVTLAYGKGAVPRSDAQLAAEARLATLGPERRARLRRAGGQQWLWRRGAVTGLSQTLAARDLDGALQLAAEQLRGPHAPPTASKTPHLDPQLLVERRLLAAALLSLKPTPAPLSPQTRLAPDNATLVVIGDVEPQSLVKRVKELLGVLSGRSGTPAANTAPVAQSSARHLSVRWPRAGGQLAYGWVVPGVASKERTLVPLLQALLASPQPGSARHQLLYVDTIAAQLRATSSARSTHDVMWLSVTLPAATSPFAAVEPIDAHTRRLAANGPRQAELSGAKRRLALRLAQTLDTPAQLGPALAYHQLLNGDASALLKQNQAAQHATIADVKRFAARWLLPSRATALELLPARPAPRPTGKATEAQPKGDTEAAHEAGGETSQAPASRLAPTSSVKAKQP